MRAFQPDDIAGLAEYAPEALAVSRAVALRLAEQKRRSQLDLPSLGIAIVVFSALEPAPGERLSTADRDELWTAFGLPVFEQLRGRDGGIIARECEVHDGLHFDDRAVAAEVKREELFVSGTASGACAEIVRTQCECGLETPRLRWLSRVNARAAAA
jgi:hypothetical protein